MILEQAPFSFGAACLPSRFWSKVSVHESGCWVWSAAKNALGYGRFRLSQPRRMVLPHVHAFVVFCGEVPPGKELDHLCRNPSCVNPAHLEPVTHQVNMQRSAPATRECCPQGHPYTAENTYMEGSKRHCRVCRLKRVPCPDCGKIVYGAGLARHRRRLHLSH